MSWPANWLKLQDVLKPANFGNLQGPETLTVYSQDDYSCLPVQYAKVINERR